MMPLAKVKKVMYSKHNYKKLTRLMAEECLQANPVLNTLEMQPPGKSGMLVFLKFSINLFNMISINLRATTSTFMFINECMKVL